LGKKSPGARPGENTLTKTEESPTKFLRLGRPRNGETTTRKIGGKGIGDHGGDLDSTEPREAEREEPYEKKPGFGQLGGDHRNRRG